uniref:CSON006917 protein n=1 Tax=Culicoides sonorensis TaxID=179676 RepID=A0A336MT82_CULSO
MSQVTMEKLTDSNYLTWALKMKMVLIKEGCWSVVKERAPEGMDPVDLEMKKEKSLSLIVLAVENDQLVHVRNSNTGYDAWEALKTYHQQATVANKIRILKKLFRMELKKGGNLKDHLKVISEYMDELAEMNTALDKDVAVSVILASLNEEYDGLVTAMEAWDESRLNIVTVKAKLMEEYEKKNNKVVKENDVAMVSNKAFGDEYGPKCFHCGSSMHFKRNCPRFLAMKEGNNGKFDLRNKLNDNKEGSAKQARFQRWYHCLLFCGMNSNNWFVDSGASNHMCNDEKVFQSLKSTSESKIILADGDKLVSNNIGDVKLSLKTNSDDMMNVLIKDVLHVPNLKGNLISVHKLVKNGFDVLFRGSECLLIKDNDMITIATFENGLYKVNTNNVEEKLMTVQQENKNYCVHEWHKILAHRNLSDIQKMKDLGLNIKDCNCSNLCEPCIVGKMKANSFPLSQTLFENSLDCIVSDVCGPMEVESIGRSRYFITFIDLHTKYCEVQFMRTKDETKIKVKQFIEKDNFENKINDMVVELSFKKNHNEYLTENEDNYETANEEDEEEENSIENFSQNELNEVIQVQEIEEENINQTISNNESINFLDLLIENLDMNLNQSIEARRFFYLNLGRKARRLLNRCGHTGLNLSAILIPSHGSAARVGANL